MAGVLAAQGVGFVSTYRRRLSLPDPRLCVSFAAAATGAASAKPDRPNRHSPSVGERRRPRVVVGAAGRRLAQGAATARMQGCAGDGDGVA